MLTDECKKFVYTSLDKFKTLYYNRIFTEKRMYQLENWYTTPSLKTYHITYIEDILSSGNTTPERSIGDYITVENKEKENRLNIGSYIGYKDLSREEERNGIKITVNKMYMYMDYTVLDIRVKNLTKNTILLDSKEENNTLYLYDENGVRYTSFLNENAEEELKVRSQMEKSIMIKFNKMYNPTSRTLAGISFNDIVLNYDDYSNETTSKQITKLNIKL